MSFFKDSANDHDLSEPSILLTTTEHQVVFYSISAPGVGYNTSGNFTSGDQAIIDLPNDLMITSTEQQDKGVYIMTNSSKVTVIGENWANDSYVALQNSRICFKEYVYYGILFGFGQVLIVGTEDDTVVKLTVQPQPVNITLGDNTTVLLSPGKEHSLILDRLQTLLIEMVTESKLVVNKPISVFSGHKCGSIPTKSGLCGQMIEQIPPTTLWGKRYYVASLGTKYTIKVLAACNKTTVDICCNNKVTSYMMHEGMEITDSTLTQEHCIIYSDKKILVVQYSHSYWDESNYNYKHNPMMTLVPSEELYTNKFSSSTIIKPIRSDYRHYVSIIVLSEHYQPEMIHMITGGVSQSMDSQQWEPIKFKKKIKAYATTVTISEGSIEIIHTHSSALMTAIVYGFANSASYGHSGGFFNLETFTGKFC